MAKVQRLTHADILAELERFERKYGEASAVFHERFVNGKAGDSADAFEWAALYEWSVELATADLSQGGAASAAPARM